MTDLDLLLVNEPRSRIDWSPFYLEFDALQTRLANVKKDFGMRKAVSNKSLKGETRTLAEILDKEVEKIVLFYLRIQGEIAERTWKLRENQVNLLKGDAIVTVQQIESMCQLFRDLSYEVIELLQFLDFNVTGLRRIIKRHDKLFDLKMGRIYFDSRLQGGARHSPLLQLYHQEGIRAIGATIRKGFEDLHEARIDITSINNWQANKQHRLQQQQQQQQQQGESVFGTDDTPPSNYNYGAIPTSVDVLGLQQPVPAPAGLSRISSRGSLLVPHNRLSPSEQQRRQIIPRTRYLSRLKVSASISSPHLGDLGEMEEDNEGLLGGGGGSSSRADEARAKTGSGSYYDLALAGGGSSIKRMSGWLSGRSYDSSARVTLTRTVSDLEPCLRRLHDTQEKVVRSQQRTTTEYLASHSIMALEKQDEDDGEEDEESAGGMGLDLLRGTGKVTSKFGLFMNLLVTFLYMANQYVVAPTSAEYSEIMGQSKAMSGLIIGLSPAAALVSALVYSIWTNYSFKHPLVVSAAVAALGNLMYGVAFQMDSPNLLFYGRIVTGLGAPRGIARRYISDHVSYKHRTLAASHFVTASALGLAFGPLVSSVVTFANINVKYSVGGVTIVRLVNVTAPGWIMFALWTTALFFIITGFEEPLKPPPSSSLGGSRRAHPLLGRIWPASSADNANNTTAAANSRAAGYSPVSGWDLYENVVSVELGDMLGTGGGEKEETEPSPHQQQQPQQQQQLYGGGGRHRTRSVSSDIVEGALTLDPTPPGSAERPVGGGEEEEREGKGRGSRVGLGRGLGLAYEDNTTSDEGSPDRRYGIAGAGARGMGYHAGSVPHIGKGSRNSISHSNNKNYNEAEAAEAEAEAEAEAAAEAETETRGSSNRLWDYLDYDVTMILLFYFVNKTAQEMVVSAVPLLTNSLFGWNYNSAGFFMAAMGAMVLPSTLFISGLKDVEERYLALMLFYAELVAMLLVVSLVPSDYYSPSQYSAGSVLLFSFLCAQEGVIMSLLSKVIPPEMARGTLNSGFLTTEVGTLGRVLSDLAITLVVGSDAGLSPTDTVNHLFVPIAVAVALSLVLFRANYDNYTI
jgi:MFS family permease